MERPPLNNPAKKKKRNMPFPLLAAGIGAAGSAIAGALGYAGQKKTNEANMELAKYQYSKNLEMWNKQNAYNSPMAQMDRLKDAGLNPALVYGNGAVGNTSGSMPQYNAPTLDYNYVPPVQEMLAGGIGMYQDFQIKQAQINNLREQNKVIRETGIQKDFANQFFTETRYDRAFQEKMKAMKGDQERMNLDMKNQQMKQLFPYQFDLMKGKVRSQDLGIELLEKQGRKLDASIDYQNKVNDWYLTKLFSQLGLQAIGKITDFIPSKAGSKALGKIGGDSKAPWNTTLKVNPRRRIPSKGVVNP